MWNGSMLYDDEAVLLLTTGVEFLAALLLKLMSSKLLTLHIEVMCFDF